MYGRSMQSIVSKNRYMQQQRHTISVLVENKFGVLTRVTGLFSGRGYNIDSLNVGPTHDPSLSRMTIVTTGMTRLSSRFASSSPS